jgi:hypothetical protein
MAQVVEHGGHLVAGAVGVALHLQHRNRRPRESAVGELHGVLRVLPPLVGQRPVAGLGVLDQAVPVRVPGTTQPAQRHPGGRQQRLERRAGRPPAHRLPQHDQEQRRGVGAAVVGADPAAGALPEPGQVAEADLVQDLAGLLTVARVVDPALPRGQGGQHVHHQLRPERAGLVAGDQRVAAEQGDEPRDTRRQQPPRRVPVVRDAQRVQVDE